MLTEPAPTPYDLRWTMFGIPVRVHPYFWLISLLMGSGGGELNLTHLAIWVACVFISILIHELGHVWMGKVFGSHGHIVLYSLGGLAIGSNSLDRRWQRIAVSAAGPGAGFVFLALLLAVLWVTNPATFPAFVFPSALLLGIPIDWLEPPLARPHPLLFMAVYDLTWINLIWGLVNLLPIYPLDGGQISRDVCEGISAARGLTTSLGISMVTAGILAVHCFVVAAGLVFLPLPIGGLFAGVFFAVMAVQSYLILQQAYEKRRWMEDRWEE